MARDPIIAEVEHEGIEDRHVAGYAITYQTGERGEVVVTRRVYYQGATQRGLGDEVTLNRERVETLAGDERDAELALRTRLADSEDELLRKMAVEGTAR